MGSDSNRSKSNSLRACGTIVSADEYRQPCGGIGTMRGDDFLHPDQLTCPARYHRKLGVEAFEVELADDAVVSLLDQEHARARFEPLLDQAKLLVREAEPLGVLGDVCIRVGKEDFGGRLLDECSANRAVQNITRTLSGQTHDAVQLAPGLWAVLCEAFECGVGKQPPKFVHPAHQPAAVEHATSQMK